MAPVLTVATKNTFLKEMKVLELSEKPSVISNSIQSKIVFLRQIKIDDALENE